MSRSRTPYPVTWNLKLRCLTVLEALKPPLTQLLLEASRNGRYVHEYITNLQSWTDRITLDLKDKILLSVVLSGYPRIPEPPYPRLLISNEPPTEEESGVVQQAIAVAEEEIESLNRVLQSNPSSFSLIRRQQLDYATRYVSQHKAVVSHIRRIPVELLQQIFITYHYESCLDWLSPTMHPFNLAHVCRQWRTIVTNLPYIWAHIPHISLQAHPEQSYIDGLENVIKLSKNAPITFSIYANHKSILVNPVLALLARHSERWERVSFHCPLETFASIQSVKNNLPLLKKLRLTIMAKPDQDETLDLFEVAPSLREVSIEGFNQVIVELPFPQLQQVNQFCIQLSRTSPLSRILPLAVDSLQSLTFLDRIGYASHDPSLTLSSLLALHIHFDDTPSVILNKLTLPAVEQIRLASLEGSSWLLRQLASLLYRSSPSPWSPYPLRKLSLQTDIEPGELIRVLSYTPNLNELEVSLPPVVDLSAFAVRGHDPLQTPRRTDFVPYLQSLIIHVKDLNGFDDAISPLQAIAETRCELPSLPSIAPSESDPTLPGELRRLNKLRIVFDVAAARTCHVHLQKLEKWEVCDASNTLLTLKNKLVVEFPEIRFDPIILNSSAIKTRRMDAQWQKKLMGLMDKVKRVDLKNDPIPILISGIHLFLRELAESTSLSSKAKVIQNRARNILSSWEPIFEGYPNRRKWVCKGSYSICYLSQDSPQSPSSTVYGFAEDMEDCDLFWWRFPTRYF